MGIPYRHTPHHSIKTRNTSLVCKAYLSTSGYTITPDDNTPLSPRSPSNQTNGTFTNVTHDATTHRTTTDATNGTTASDTRHTNCNPSLLPTDKSTDVPSKAPSEELYEPTPTPTPNPTVNTYIGTKYAYYSILQHSTNTHGNMQYDTTDNASKITNYTPTPNVDEYPLPPPPPQPPPDHTTTPNSNYRIMTELISTVPGKMNNTATSFTTSTLPTTPTCSQSESTTTTTTTTVTNTQPLPLFIIISIFTSAINTRQEILLRLVMYTTNSLMLHILSPIFIYFDIVDR